MPTDFLVIADGHEYAYDFDTEREAQEKASALSADHDNVTIYKRLPEGGTERVGSYRLVGRYPIPESAQP